MENRNKGVSIKVHPLFFDNVFERKRKKLEKKFKISLSQVKFTEYLAKNGVRMKIKKPNNKFTPKELKKRRFYV
jgi:hypothetical protein